MSPRSSGCSREVVPAKAGMCATALPARSDSRSGHASDEARTIEWIFLAYDGRKSEVHIRS